ncbi:MAG: SDR family oxidoreductase [Thaumarchaeota archaeon]|nr:SDR family oxidoreductase [Nitrososphaerota archaeon]
MRLADKVAIVTGGGYGIGRGASLLFASEGAKTVVVDWNEKTGAETMAQMDGLGEGMFIKADVSQLKDIESAVSLTVQKFGKVDILFNNAGVNCFKSTLQTEESDWQRLVDINLKGAFFFAKSVAKTMMERGGGTILFTSSISGVSGEDDQVAYSATKGGIIALVTAMAKDLGRYKIRVNCLLPGPIDTQQFRDWMSSKADQGQGLGEAVDSTILKRIGMPVDVAKAALFLVSDDASWITGIAMPVDGGYLVRH